MTQISLDKNVFKKNNFEKIVDTRFKQLIGNQPTQGDITISDFFQIYEDLFYQIPKDGDIESHKYILNKTAEYLGVKISEDNDVQALLNEITLLRNELLDANKVLLDLTKK
jgi:hypothetical protein